MTWVLSVATAKLYANQLEDIHHTRFPRVDYIELQQALQAKTIDYSAYDQTLPGKIFRPLETQLRSDLYLAALGWLQSRKNSVVFTWSERAGIPFAFFTHYLLSKIHFITMFTCWSKRQEAVITNLRLFSAMDEILVHCTSMKQNLVRLGAPEHKTQVLRYSIDQDFFSPMPAVEPQKNLIISIGEPRSRNYSSLFQAVKGLPVNLQLPAYGHWYAREKKGGQKWHPPPNVTLLPHLSPTELRDFYTRAQFAVLPLQNLVYSAGATATLEANCMARPVIAYRSPGITDYIINGETGMLVEPGDTEALKDAIKHLLANPAEAKRLGENARQRIIEEFRLETYVENIARILRAHNA